MNNRLLLLLLLLAVSFSLPAQDKKNIRTDVLVVGHESAAVAAALQSAISGVHTLLLTSEKELTILPSETPFKSGIEALLLNKVRTAAANTDSTANTDKTILNSVFQQWADSTKNLTILKDMGWNKLERSGSGWLIKLKDDRSIRAKILVYATGKPLNETPLYQQADASTTFTYSDNLYRTSVAGSDNHGVPVITSLYKLIPAGEENLVLANFSDANLATGQAAGATAAFAAFFKVKTSAANLKAIQGELLNYKLNMLPFSDVAPADTNWRAIQNVGLTGILKARMDAGRAWFDPELPVVHADIKQPIKDLFYKAQIWFDDYPNVPVNIENTIAMVSYVGNKSPENTQIEIEKKWNKGYGFGTVFNLKKELTRREFAVLINDYLKPFDVNIDKTGRIIR